MCQAEILRFNRQKLAKPEDNAEGGPEVMTQAPAYVHAFKVSPAPPHLAPPRRWPPPKARTRLRTARRWRQRWQRRTQRARHLLVYLQPAGLDTGRTSADREAWPAFRELTLQETSLGVKKRCLRNERMGMESDSPEGRSSVCVSLL